MRIKQQQRLLLLLFRQGLQQEDVGEADRKPQSQCLAGAAAAVAAAELLRSESLLRLVLVLVFQACSSGKDRR
jgi:hypothetical protein